jgi:hypothetical protein
MNENFIAVVALGALLMAGLGMWLGGMKNRGFEGMILGLLLGPIGLIIAILLPEGKPTEKTEIKEVAGGGIPWRNSRDGKAYAKRKNGK